MICLWGDTDMDNAFSRLENMLGRRNTEKLAHTKIAVFGLGSVGSFATEALARCGIGSFTLVDNGIIAPEDISINPYALSSTVGKSRVSIAKEHIHAIDESILVNTYETLYSEDTAGLFDLKYFDYIIDAMDDIKAKVSLISRARQNGARIITSACLDNMTEASRLAITDISRTGSWLSVRQLREELKKTGTKNVKVLASKEHRKSAEESDEDGSEPGGCIFYLKGIAGMMIASEIIKDLTEPENVRKKRVIPVRCV